MARKKRWLTVISVLLLAAAVVGSVLWLARERFISNYVALREGIPAGQVVNTGEAGWEYERGTYWNVYYSMLPLEQEDGGSDEWYEFLFLKEKDGRKPEEVKEDLRLEYWVRGDWYRAEIPHEFVVEEGEEGEDGEKEQVLVMVRQFDRGGGYFWKGKYRLLERTGEEQWHAVGEIELE